MWIKGFESPVLYTCEPAHVAHKMNRLVLLRVNVDHVAVAAHRPLPQKILRKWRIRGRGGRAVLLTLACC